MKKTALLIALLCAVPLAAQHGVSAERVLLGQSCALKGPAAALGTGMRAGLNAAFAEANAKGGVNGRKIRLLSINDGYEPARCTMVTRMLVAKQDVFLLIGGVGTPTAKVAVPIAAKNEVPFVAPFTGAEFLRHDDQVVNVRGSYYQEMETLAAYLVDQEGMERIACFYQDDGYGQAGLSGIERALERRGLELCGTGTYKRNTLAIKKGLQEVRASDPEAVVMVGAYRPCAQFIRQARSVSSMNDTVFCNISFVGTRALVEELGGDDRNCIVSQVVPFPWDDSLPLVKHYHRVMEEHASRSDVGFITLEGYMAAASSCRCSSRSRAPRRARSSWPRSWRSASSTSAASP